MIFENCSSYNLLFTEKVEHLKYFVLNSQRTQFCRCEIDATVYMEIAIAVLGSGIGSLAHVGSSNWF